MSENYWIQLATNDQFKGKFKRLEQLLDKGLGFEEAIETANINKHDLQQLMQVVTAEYERNKTRKYRGKPVTTENDEIVYQQVLTGIRNYCQNH